MPFLILNSGFFKKFSHGLACSTLCWASALCLTAGGLGWNSSAWAQDPVQEEADSVLIPRWSVFSPLPADEKGEAHVGLAGSFGGQVGDIVIMAGGANFPAGVPWQGGVRQLLDRVILIPHQGAQPSKARVSAVKLPKASAYGASISLPEGLLCIGGVQDDGVSNEVTLLKVDAQRSDISLEKWPALPFPLTKMSGAKVGNTIYVCGGQKTAEGEAPTKTFLALDLSLKGKPGFAWKALPAWDGPARVLSVVTAQFDGREEALYLMSGRGIDAETRQPAYFTDVWKFSPSTGTWKMVGEIELPSENPRSITAGSAAPYGKSGIVVFGGDDGSLAQVYTMLSTRVLVTTEEQEAFKRFNIALLDHHPGYSREVLMFNTVTEKWSPLTTAPQRIPVTSNAIPLYQDAETSTFVLTCGEFSPGIRCSDLWALRLPAEALVVPQPQVPDVRGPQAAGTPVDPETLVNEAPPPDSVMEESAEEPPVVDPPASTPAKPKQPSVQLPESSVVIPAEPMRLR